MIQSDNIPPADLSRMAGDPTSLNVHVLRSWGEVDRVLPDWDGLLGASPCPSAFQSRDWLEAWWRAYGDFLELMLLVFSDSTGRVAAIAPLYRRRYRRGAFHFHALHLVGDGSLDSAGLDLIVRAEAIGPTVTAFLDWLLSTPGEWDVLQLSPVLAESPFLSAVREQAQARGILCAARETPHLVRPLPERWEDLLQELSPRTREAVRRKLRRVLSKHSVSLRLLESEENIEEYLKNLFRFNSERWRGRSEHLVFASPERQCLYDEISHRFLRKGWLRFWQLELDGTPVASEFGFEYERNYSFVQGGFDPAHAALGIGVVVKAEIFRRLISSRTASYDLLSGEEPHKLHWQPQRRAYVELQLAAPGVRGAIVVGLGSRMRRLAHAVRDRLPSGMRSALGYLYRGLKPR